MDTYTFLTEVADNWVLVGFFSFFVAVVIRVLLPRTNKAHSESAEIPFRHEDRPADEEAKS